MEILGRRAVSRRRGLTLLLLLISLVPLRVTSLGQVATEYQVKAAYIYNFTKFIEWPQAIVTPAFTICILGDDPFESAIDRLTAGKTAYGHPIQVRRPKNEAETKQCQMVFVGAADRSKAVKLIEVTQGSPVFTVGESQEFLRIGGMVILSMEGNLVKVTVNKAPTESAGFKVSANLMTLAKIYKP